MAKNMRTVFESRTSWDDAEVKARLAGFKPVGRGRHPSGLYIVFAERVVRRLTI
jgi:hypothetical protein